MCNNKILQGTVVQIDESGSLCTLQDGQHSIAVKIPRDTQGTIANHSYIAVIGRVENLNSEAASLSTDNNRSIKAAKIIDLSRAAAERQQQWNLEVKELAKVVYPCLKPLQIAA